MLCCRRARWEIADVVSLSALFNAAAESRTCNSYRKRNGSLEATTRRYAGNCAHRSRHHAVPRCRHAHHALLLRWLDLVVLLQAHPGLLQQRKPVRLLSRPLSELQSGLPSMYAGAVSRCYRLCCLSTSATTVLSCAYCSPHAVCCLAIDAVNTRSDHHTKTCLFALLLTRTGRLGYS